MSDTNPTEDPKKDAALIELQVSRVKKEIDDLLIRYHSEEGKRDQESFWTLRVAQARLSLQNCREIVKYIKKTSPAAANELGVHLSSVSASLRRVTKSHDVGPLQEWYKKELAPLLNKAELEAHLVASARRQATGDSEGSFAWTVGEPPGGEEHIKRFGKTADEFKYLEQTCPICGGRIDEMGWCGCGTMGGG